MNKEIVINLNELDKYLQKINLVFPTENVLNQKIDIESVLNYYRNSSVVYSFIHSYKGSYHLALNYDGIFNKQGFFAQLNEIIELINLSNVKNVLELGCGKGFNSVFLAKKLPQIEFSGIDISEKNLKIAKSKSNRIQNLYLTYGDFQKLDFEDSSFDLIFDVEAICHGSDARQVLSEVFRVLKKGGQFVVYDGFRQNGFESLPDNLVEAAVIVEKSMSVNSFEEIDSWLEMAGHVGFKVKLKKDLSQYVKPNLAKLQLLARKYFEFPFLAKLFVRIFRKYTMLNCIAVLLLPFTMYNKAHCYYKIILEK
ncbi:MAG: class I SAM-dependent methyltransferase [Syntrophaceae bacterium]|nr:class I SAM-dependent methyltransferase [Syntrophaceae bacterium]